MDNVKLSYKDVSIVPAPLSYVEHRNECNPFVDGKHLPIFTAPMTSIINTENFNYFNEKGLIPILPRNIDFNIRMQFALEKKWSAFSLSEFENFWVGQTEIKTEANVLIDVANGHMAKIYDLVKKSKKIYGEKIVVMIGNIANPDTYKYACTCGADYVRVGIGGGEGCITSTNTNIHYPMVSLLQEIKNIRKYIPGFTTKVIADGGIRNYSDINTALACGADYVMIGGMLARTFESSAPFDTPLLIDGKVLNNGYEILVKYPNFNFRLYNYPITKEFFGMASEKGQESIGSEPKIAEGLVKNVTVTQTLTDFVENAKHNLQSAMSYCNATTLYEFSNKTEIIQISNNSYNSVNH